MAEYERRTVTQGRRPEETRTAQSEQPDHRSRNAASQNKDSSPAENGGFRKKSWQEIAEARREQLNEVTNRLEKGLREYMANDEQFKKVLDTMAKFHHYSARNVLLIAMQMPSATYVASYENWQKKFNRQVKKGQKGLSIIIPAPYKKKTEREVTDPVTKKPVLDRNGNPKTEEVEVTVPRFKVAKVFDLSQTVGDPLPELDVPELAGNAENYQLFMEALREVSPVPIRFGVIPGEAKGYYDNRAKEIVIREGMSESQTMKTAVHEAAHARLHDRGTMEAEGVMKDQRTREIEAEAIAYTVLSHYSLDTSGYSIPYLASWSGSRDTKALQDSMDTIRTTSAQFIDEVDTFMKERMKERDAERFTVYQLKSSDDTRAYRFVPMEVLKNEGLEIHPEFYREVYRGELSPGDDLEDIYIRFNQGTLPEDYKGHSLSVSDIVVLHQEGGDRAFYVDRFGYQEVPEFLQEMPPQEKGHAMGSEVQEASDPAAEPPSLSLRYYVAECMDFPVMGEYHGNLSLARAAELYRSLPQSDMQGGKGIGCMVSDGQELDISCSLVRDGHVLDGAFSELDQYRDSPVLQSALREARSYFPDPVEKPVQDNRTDIQNETDMQRYADHAGPAGKPVSAMGETHTARRPAAGHEHENMGGRDDAGERSEKQEPAGRKDSVLASLREHIKNVSERNKGINERTRSVQNRKGGPEL